MFTEDMFCFAAIDLINNLLQVKMRKRYSVDKTLSHPWLQVSLSLLEKALTYQLCRSLYLS